MSQREVLDVAHPTRTGYHRSTKLQIAYSKLATTHLSHFLFRCQIEARPLAHGRPGRTSSAVPAGVLNQADATHNHINVHNRSSRFVLGLLGSAHTLSSVRRVMQALHTSYEKSPRKHREVSIWKSHGTHPYDTMINKKTNPEKKMSAMTP